MPLRWRIPDDIWPGLIGGLLSGLVGALLFATAHAFLIVPIWTRMGSGLVFGALAGTAAGWALLENYPRLLASPPREAGAVGARFGGILWLLVVPVTAADVVLRAAGIARRFELVAVGVALILAVGGGATFGWRRTHGRRGMISGAVATLALTMAMGGPVPVARSPRAFGIFAAVLPTAVIAGSVLGLLARRLHHLQVRRRLMFGLMLALQVGTLSAQGATNTVYDRVILGGRVMDPASKLDAVRNVGLLDGRIAVITTQAVRGRDTIDARGLVVAPGFIDIHAHGQTPETYRFYSLDGVTTALELEFGTSDVDAWYRERSAGERINYGVSIGHIKVRMAVMHDSGTVIPVADGAYCAASAAQIAEIAKRIETGLSQGAVDIGAGFPYTPAATREELLAVFRVAAKTKTPVHVHITPGVTGLKEALSLAGETNAPLHVVHINSAGLAETPVMLRMVADARARGRDVTTEAYPYDAGMTEIQSATIQDIYKTAPDARLAELEWQNTGERLNRESFERYSRIGGPIVVHANTEQMVAVAIKSPLTIIASDAYWQNGAGHPRTTGTFSRVLGRYVRETHALSLMEAIRKMTLMPAQRLEARVPAMRQKGRLRVGADADITIFDAARVVDRSTYREPSLSPVGIQHVIVNGVSVVANARSVEGVAPGKAVRAPIAPNAGASLDAVRRELVARYTENEAGFYARDADRVMRLRHPAFHTITPDGNVSTREQMYQRTRQFIGRIERFDSLSETITALTLAGDTAHAVVDQRTVRQQRFPDGALHEIRTSVVQRESWIKTREGWFLWRVDQIQPGQTLVDGKPPQQ